MTDRRKRSTLMRGRKSAPPPKRPRYERLDSSIHCGQTTGDEYTGPIGCNLPAGHDMVPADHPDYDRFHR